MSARTVRSAVALAAVVGVVAAAGPARAATPRPTTCLTTTVRVSAGTTTALALDCRVRSGGRTRWVARGSTGGPRTITSSPSRGTLSGLRRTIGVVRFRAPSRYAGTTTLRFRVRLTGGRSATGRVRIVVRKAAPEHHHPMPDPTPAPAPAPAAPALAPAVPADPEPTPEPAGDGLPAFLPLAPSSVAASTRAWSPTAQDTCPKAVHDRYAVIGPDGKRYPTWHPPTTTDPATGRTCTFGHEHGRDPSGSKILRWVTERLAAAGHEAYAGVPFGLATEALDTWATSSNAPTAHRHTRSEDHPGYKVEYENDVPLVGADGAGQDTTCDYLVEVHQGSHSPDALSNNVHETLYAARCSDGTQAIVSTVGRFGAAGRYTPACRPGETVASTDNGYPAGSGFRSIPDRGCVETNVLVPPGRTTSAWALYEKWGLSSTIGPEAAGAPLVAFDAAFGVFNPSRYAAGATTAARTIDLCWETQPGTSDRASSAQCDTATGGGTIVSPFAFDDVRSPFDGTYRDVYFGDVRVDNVGGPTTWWTDPYGGHPSTTPFPGSLRQTVSAARTVRPRATEQVFGRNRRAPAAGVHPPN